MYNWNTPKNQLQPSEETTIWKLNQLINFGLGDEKLNFSDVKKYWDKLNLDPERKNYLSFLLWGKLS